MSRFSSRHEDPKHPKAPPNDAGETSGGEAEASPPAEKTGEIDAIRKERDDLKDQLLRSRAEFVNYQKRSKEQATADRVYAIGDLARDLLDAVDNLDRAAEALKTTAAPGIASGLEMVHKQILGILAKYGVEPIEALGQPFDPNYHDALMQQPTADAPEGTVVAELGKGYKIHDRVLRPSKVGVSVKPAQ